MANDVISKQNAVEAEIGEAAWRASPPFDRLRAMSRAWGSETIVLVVILVLGTLVGLGNPVFFSGQNLLNILQAVAVVGIAAIGPTLVVVSGNLDLSVGSVISLGGLMTAIAMGWGLPFEAAALV